MPQKITPFFWFDTQAGEAADFYTSLFPNSKITSKSMYGPNMPMPEGIVMTVAFELNGQNFVALNGGPVYKFNEAISFVISCKDQEEVDYYWNKLSSDGGEEGPCGWLKDKFGVSWQVVPTALYEYIGGADAEGAQRATQCMMQMKKLIIEDLKNAYEGK